MYNGHRLGGRQSLVHRPLASGSKKEKVLNPLSFKTFSVVGAPGFEPGASWTRTKRDTKLRHAPITALIYYIFFSAFCQVEYLNLATNTVA